VSAGEISGRFPEIESAGIDLFGPFILLLYDFFIEEARVTM